MNQPVSPTPFTSRRSVILAWINRLLIASLLVLTSSQPGWAAPSTPASQRSQSATVTVTNTNDTGPGSLRQAIADANPGDTIVIGVTGTIFLLSGELVINKNLTIQGPGANLLALSGEFQRRVLRVGSDVTVRISQITVKEGLDSVGGGIYNLGDLTLIDSVIADSTASGGGGGIYNSGHLTLINSTVVNNSVNPPGEGNGSGIYSTGTMTVTGSLISENSGKYSIYSTGTMTVTGSLISENSGRYSIYNSGVMSVTNSRIERGTGGVENRGNFAMYRGQISGHGSIGILNTSPGQLTLQESIVSSNSATGINNSGVAHLTMSSVNSNSGGGISNSSFFSLLSSAVYSNTNTGHGVGIHNSSTFTATNSTISGNRSTSNGNGGGIHNGGGTLLLANSTVAQNTAYCGGGIFVTGGTTTIRNSLIASSASGSDICGTVQSQGYNFFGDTQGATILGTDIGHKFGNPRLGPLADNGGPTLTHALLSDSPAIDGGKPTGCRDSNNVFLTTDQRSAARTVDGNSDGEAICDIGAYEYVSEFEVTPTPTPDPISSPTLTAITPTEGVSTGGTTITLQGGNFQSGMAAKLDGATCTNLVVNNSNNATCTTPSHFPAVVDVTVTNPGGQSATLLRGFTYRGTTASLSLPDSIADSGSTVQVPVQAAGISGLMAVSLTVSYDSAKAALRDVTLGSLSSGWSLISNTVSSGRVQISMANPGTPAQGTGSLALLHFQATGTPGQVSPLSIAGVSLNDGTIPTTTTAGSLVIDTLSTLSGTVGYWAESRPVSGVALQLTGSNSRTGTSDSSGLFSLADVPSGNYTLAPSKSDGVGTDAITSFDASLVLRHSAGVESLTGNAAVAADVDGSGSITPMDASYILRKSVRLIDVPFPGAGRVWSFAPASRAYAPLTGDQTNQNFTALLVGDVSGNWGRPQSQTRSGGEIQRLSLGVAGDDSLGGHRLTLSPDGMSVYSVDLILGYSPESSVTPAVALSTASQNFALSSHSPAAGLLYIGLAGASPIESGGDLLTIRWVDGNGNPVQAPLAQVIEARINETPTQVTVEPGNPQDETGARRTLYLPAVGR